MCDREREKGKKKSSTREKNRKFHTNTTKSTQQHSFDVDRPTRQVGLACVNSKEIAIQFFIFISPKKLKNQLIFPYNVLCVVT